MDVKHLRSRRTNQDLISNSFSPKAEKHKSPNGKIKVSDNYVCKLGKNTSITSLPPTIMKDQKCPGSDSLIPSPESPLSRKEVMLTQSVDNQFKFSTLTSSMGTQNTDIVPQKRPVKLAPLDLSAEMKEAQLKKLIEMKDEVYLGKKIHCHQGGSSAKILTDRPIKKDPSNKVGLSEHKLPKLDDIISVKDKIVLKDPSTSSYAPPGKEGLSSFSMLKFKSVHVHGSVPKIVLKNPIEGQNVSVKGHYKYEKSPSANQIRSKPMKANGLIIDYVGQTSDSGHRKK
ncbi:uncharacterized protein LOC142158070 [Mixophyes fleayi]|uniref:uncharacterized protein LOC142158070 n=1 Tax=Mixophyes fleayi TaxID=3061075 RepID=UPI003F4D8B58